MRTYLKALGAGTLLMLTAVSVPAAAAAPPEPPPVGAFVLTVQVGQMAPANSPRYVVVLQCGPLGGTHPRGRQACEEILKAGGDFTKLPGDPKSRACTREYNPTTVTAVGLWKDRRVKYDKTFANPCVKRGATGAVFAF
ncbi:SSI family serine proteinase inhibitor [Rhizohabitans arisaemae]|uniref:SSI family serine proteinase inhibitor n=1 Tax=Rhizohabitans arisaemae TaxID=2720610 RepID=UPI0024B23004|nr:SSI family serine proteinase inhibitor [Rhizohabitans arisaemae]